MSGIARAITPLLLSTLLAAPALWAREVPVRNWPVPPGSLAIGLAEATFVPVAPCRLADTRGNGFTGAWGPPTLSIGAGRDVPVTGKCGIPSGAVAASFNVTVTNTQGPGYITSYPTGGAPPTVSTVNYVASQTIANAAIVPLSAPGKATFVANVSGTDLVLDVNGYFEEVLDGGNLTVNVDNGVAAIRGMNSSGSDYSAGVLGSYLGSAIGHGVEGTTSGASGSAGLRGLSSQGAVTSYGAKGDSRSTGLDSAGVYGYQYASSGNVHGLLGSVESPHGSASGVYGRAASADANGGRFNNVGANVVAFLATQVSAAPYALYTSGTVKCGTLQATTKNFVAPHPEDAGKEIVYTSVEAPTADIYFRGTGRLVDGVARIEVPEHFRVSARAGSYATTLTPVGAAGSLFVQSEGPDGIVVSGPGALAFHYLVHAEREAIQSEPPVRPNVSFTPDAIAKGGGVGNLPEGYREALVRNGTLRPDGTFDEVTARRQGWTLPDAPVVP